MNNSFRIVLDSDLMPVQAFFNVIPERSFLEVLRSFSHGVGASFDDCHCEFPGDQEPEDDPFQGVLFALYEQEVILDNKEFLDCLKIVCGSFVESRPDLKDDVMKGLEAVEKTLLKV